MLWGGLALVVGGGLLALTVLLPDVFAAMGNTRQAQFAGAALAVLGVLVLGHVLARIDLSVEFGEQIRVRRAFAERFIEWNVVAAIEVIQETDEVRPFERLGSLPVGIGDLAHATGATNLASFSLTTRRLCIRLKDGFVVRCDVRLLEWERVAKLATEHAIPISAV